jgi:hypothetical protein
MTDWREDGQAAHEYALLMQEREEWLRDEQAQREYQEFLNHAVKDSAKGNNHEQKQSN